MTTFKRSLILTFVIVLLCGCAGRKYNFSEVRPDIQVSPVNIKSVAIVAADQRKVVISGECPPTYLGVQRGSFGIPNNINTESGLPLSDDLTIAVSESLLKKGLKTYPLSMKVANFSRISELFSVTKADRYFLFVIKKWESDTAVNIGLDYEIELTVYGPGMTKLESITVSEYKNIARSGWENSGFIARREVPLAFKNVLEKLLNYPGILKSLQ